MCVCVRVRVCVYIYIYICGDVMIIILEMGMPIQV